MVEDWPTPYGAQAIADAYSKAGMDYELHLFPFGSLGLGTTESANGSSQLAAQDFGRADVRG